MFFGRRSKNINKVIWWKDTEIMTRLMFVGWIIDASNAKEFVVTLVELIIFSGAVKQMYMGILFEIVYYGLLLAIQ